LWRAAPDVQTLLSACSMALIICRGEAFAATTTSYVYAFKWLRATGPSGSDTVDYWRDE
jgi:hypothetical protein